MIAQMFNKSLATMFKIIVVVFIVTIVSCEEVEDRIVGGSNALDGEFPYQVSIRYRGVHDCGGAILDKYWILTAAHCLRNRLLQKMTIVTGTNHLDQGGDTYNVSKIIPHRKFSSLTRQHDIGLLRVQTPIEFGPKVQPIRISSKYVENGEILTLAGWGQINDDDEEPSNELKKINLEAISNFKCSFSLKPNFIWNTNLCTLEKRGKGACYGDSGGPLVSKDGLKGIVSWSRPCALGKPDVFTRVASYLSWIKINKQ